MEIQKKHVYLYKVVTISIVNYNLLNTGETNKCEEVLTEGD